MCPLFIHCCVITWDLPWGIDGVMLSWGNPPSYYVTKWRFSGQALMFSHWILWYLGSLLWVDIIISPVVLFINYSSILYTNVNTSVDRVPLELEHGWVIISHGFVWMCVPIHALNLVVQCGAIILRSIFVTNIHKRHPIACLLRWGMVCLLWIQHLMDILPQFL